MNRKAIDVEDFTKLLKIYAESDGTITIHMIEKLVFHLVNHTDGKEICPTTKEN